MNLGGYYNKGKSKNKKNKRNRPPLLPFIILALFGIYKIGVMTWLFSL